MKQMINKHFPLLEETGSVWPDKIINAVVSYAKVKRYKLFLVNNEYSEINKLRIIAMWLMWRLTSLDHEEIANIFRCDTGKVQSAIKGVKIKSKTHKETNLLIKAIEEILIPLEVAKNN